MARRSRSYKTRMANLRGDGSATRRRKEEQSQASSSLDSSQENIPQPLTNAQATNSNCNSRRVLNNSNGQRSKVPQPTAKKSPAQNPQTDQLTLATSKEGHTVTVFRHAHRKHCAPPGSNTNSTFGIFAVTEHVALPIHELVMLDVANGCVGRGEELEW
ncbi:hypothetical protein D9619_007438 [Psilocybe cf. subviscida]|uniref:Uncharacterized protein n=1 Tax=Psilocybe cf. subviscida TaxID=2480587 RepID=A0A8H5B1P3_9AGAR|nr:hypothetical protein D9619_007438 [Psilocybe cf. subviscida]